MIIILKRLSIGAGKIDCINVLIMFNLITASVGGAQQPNLMLASPKEMTTEEMRRLLERNEVLNPGTGVPNLQPYDTLNV